MWTLAMWCPAVAGRFPGAGPDSPYSGLRLSLGKLWNGNTMFDCRDHEKNGCVFCKDSLKPLRWCSGQLMIERNCTCRLHVAHGEPSCKLPIPMVEGYRWNPQGPVRPWCVYFPWRIHGAGIYANIKGMYWWDPYIAAPWILWVWDCHFLLLSACFRPIFSTPLGYTSSCPSNAKAQFRDAVLSHLRASLRLSRSRLSVGDTESMEKYI